MPLFQRGDTQEVLTCFHVIAVVPRLESLEVGLNVTTIGKVRFRAYVIRTDPNPGVDLALLRLGLDLRGMPRILDTADIKRRQESNPIALSWFAPDTEVQEGLGVVSVGYPLGLGTGDISNFPVVRFGMIAQVIPGGHTFLVDGVGTHGNSGAPVFSANGKQDFLGLVQSGPQDVIQAFDEHRNVIAELPYSSGLTNCVSAATIRKFLLGEK